MPSGLALKKRDIGLGAPISHFEHSVRENFL
jgi:hypothetical protein